MCECSFFWHWVTYRVRMENIPVDFLHLARFLPNDTVNRSQSAPRLFEDFLELAGMPDLSHWTVFLGAAFILLITPGPSIMYVVARGIAQGFRAAMLSSVGLALGDLLQVIATAFVVMGFATNSLFGCLGGRLVALTGSGGKLRTATRYAGDSVSIALGIVAAFTPSPQAVACGAR